MNQQNTPTADPTPKERAITAADSYGLTPMWAFAPILVILGSVMMTWFSAGNFATISGVDTDLGQLILVTTLLIGGALYVVTNKSRVAYYGGALLTILSVITWAYFRQQISNFQQEMAGNPFAGLVNLKIGTGLYLCILASLGVLLVGYLSREIEAREAERDPVAGEDEPEAAIVPSDD